MGSTAMTAPACTMVNILGEASDERGSEIANSLIGRALPVAGAYPHWYGKEGVKPGRKIGHITITGSTLLDAVGKKDRIRVHPGLGDTERGVGASLEPASLLLARAHSLRWDLRP